MLGSLPGPRTVSRSSKGDSIIYRAQHTQLCVLVYEIRYTFFKSIRAPAGPDDRAEDETERGLRVSDREFLNTAVIEGAITYIDGERGFLRYSLCLGLAHTEATLLSSWLKSRLSESVPTCSSMALSLLAINFFTLNARYDSHPMAMLMSAFAYLGSYYGEANPSLQGQTLFTKCAKGDAEALRNMDKQIYRLIGKATTPAAMAYRARQGRELVVPPTGISYTESFLYQLDHLSPTDSFSASFSASPSPVLARALDILLILHADHEMNASSTTVRQTGSSLPDPYSASYWELTTYAWTVDLFMGAPMKLSFECWLPSEDNVPAFLAAVKRREKVLIGFGHRVYKTSDPRSFIIRKIADEVFAVRVISVCTITFMRGADQPRSTGRDPLLGTAMALHDAALKDDYFVSRELTPNADFWSGLIYRVMGNIRTRFVVQHCFLNAIPFIGFPMDFFPVLIAVPRVVGWVAHWRQVWLGQNYE
ncbi:citrate synthase-like protein [Pisolithus thermaeus]|nr:citrate synthase-like protein [Pisolithus thermaeus]